jgi:amino acid efflux transporter
MMILSVLFNLFGLKIGSKIQTTTLLILIIILIGVILFSFPHIRTEQLTPFNPNGWWVVGYAAVVCFFSFLGWENVSSVAEEVVDPERTYQKAVGWAVAIVGVLYMAIAVVVITVIPPGESSNITVLTGVLNVISGPKVAKVGNVIAVLLLILTTNAWVLGASRLVYALSRDRILPKSLSFVSKTTGVPVMGLLILTISYTIIFSLLILTGSNERILINIANSNFLIVYLCAFIAGLKLFKTKGIRIATWIALLSTLVFLPFFKIGLLYSIVFIGLAYWLFLHSVSKENKNHVYKQTGS